MAVQLPSADNEVSVDSLLVCFGTFDGGYSMDEILKARSQIDCKMTVK